MSRAARVFVRHESGLRLVKPEYTIYRKCACLTCMPGLSEMSMGRSIINWGADAWTE